MKGSDIMFIVLAMHFVISVYLLSYLIGQLMEIVENAYKSYEYHPEEGLKWNHE